VGVLGFLAWWLPVAVVLDAIGRVPGTVWAVVVCGFLVAHVVSAFKWRLLIDAAGVPIAPLEALRAHAVGLFANLCLPSVIGGDLVRAGLVVRDHGRLEAVTLGSVADRLNDTVALVLIAGVAAWVVPELPDADVAKVLASVAVLLPAGVAVGVVTIRGFPRGRLPQRLQAVAERLGQGLDSLLGVPRVTLRAFSLSIAIQCSFVGLNVVLAQEMGIAAPVSVWFLVWPLAKLVALAPISLGGIGVREVALAGLMAPFGIDAAVAVAQSVSWEVVLIGAGLIAGMVAMVLNGRRSIRIAGKGETS
jgi:hypothetical protein